MMKKMTVFLAMGLCAAALAGCETSGGRYGEPYGRAINEGPVARGGAVVVVDRQPDYRGRDYGRIDDRRGDFGRDPRGRDFRDDRGEDFRDGFRDDRRYGDRRDPCLGLPGYDPRRDRCDR